MPLALNVLAAQRVAMLIQPGRIVLDPHVVETARATFEAHFCDRTLWVQEQRCLLPEQAGLIRCTIACNDDSLRHDGLPSRKRGVGFMTRRISTARSNRTGLSG